MKGKVVAWCLAALHITAFSRQAEAQTAIVPYNLGDAVRAADAARREQPTPNSQPAGLPGSAGPSAPAPGAETIYIRHIVIIGPHFFGEAEEHSVVAPYENRKLTLGQIYEAADKLTNLYRQRGFLVAKPYVPEQDARSGELKLKMIMGSYGVSEPHASTTRA